jgi:signal recognition particle receptor subunit beta
MAIIDMKKNQLQAKIVYYGPGLCGKTTNLEHVNKTVNSAEMMSIATEGDRTIFFDFLPLDLGKIRGIDTTFKLYTVPGQVRYNLTRKMVLKNVDGLVFVADSQRLMLDSNLESLDNMFSNMRELGMNPDTIPVVLQYNKRDLPDLLSKKELDQALNKRGYPVLLASAVRGDGVMDTLKRISKEVFAKLSEQLSAPQAKPVKVKAKAKPPQPTVAPSVQTPAPKPTQAQSTPRAKEPVTKRVQLPSMLEKPAPVQPTTIPTDVSSAQLLSQFERQAGELSKLVEKTASNDERTQGIEKRLEEIHKTLGAMTAATKSLNDTNRLVKQLTDKLAGKQEITELRKSIEKLEVPSGSTPGESIVGELRKEMQIQIEQQLGKLARKQEITNREMQEMVQRTVKTALDELREKLGRMVAPEEEPTQEPPEKPTGVKAGPEEKPGEVGPEEEVEEPENMAEEETQETQEATPEDQAEEETQEAQEATPEDQAEEETQETQEAAPEDQAEEETQKAQEADAALEEQEEETVGEQEDFTDDPRHKNAQRVARVMVADLSMYHGKEVNEGIRQGDILERLKNQIEDMQKTYKMRIQEDVRSKSDYLTEAIENFIAKKRKALGIES